MSSLEPRPGYDRDFPVDMPHWTSDIQASEQTGDSLHLWSLWHTGQEIVVDRQQSDGQVVFDLEEVR